MPSEPPCGKPALPLCAQAKLYRYDSSGKHSWSWKKMLGRVIGNERQQHLVGPDLERQVAPHQERGQYRTLRFVLDVLEKPVVARDELAVPDPQRHPAGVVAVPGDAHR